MQTLITGGAGFIGTHLSQALLARGDSVRVLDNLHPQVHGLQSEPVHLDAHIEFVAGDVTCRADLERALIGVECIYHLAAETGTGQSLYQIARYHGVNCQGTALLLDILSAGHHRVRKIVLASSRAIYGEGQYATVAGKLVYPGARTFKALGEQHWEIESWQGEPVRPTATPETAPPRPASVYALTKWNQEELLKVVCPAIGITYTILRLQNVYGEGQSLKNPYSGILSLFANCVRRGQPIPLYEDGLASRDFVHVSDVVQVLLRVGGIETAANQTFNVGSGSATPIRSVAERLCLALGKAVPIQVTGRFRLGDIRHCWADLDAIRAALGFRPEVALGAGLNRFAGWVLEQPLPEDRLDEADRAPGACCPDAIEDLQG